MEFALSDEQRLFADSLRNLLADRVPVDALRRHAETGSGFDADLWEALVDLGSAWPAGAGTLRRRRARCAGRGGGGRSAGRCGGVRAVRRQRGDGDARLRARCDRGTAGRLAAAHRGRRGAVRRRLQPPTADTSKAAIDAGAPTHLLVYLPDGNAAVVAAEDASLHMHRSIDRTRPVTDLSFDDARAVLLNAANAPLAAAQRVLDAGRVSCWRPIRWEPRSICSTRRWRS